MAKAVQAWTVDQADALGDAIVKVMEFEHRYVLVKAKAKTPYFIMDFVGGQRYASPWRKRKFYNRCTAYYKRFGEHPSGGMLVTIWQSTEIKV